MNKRTPSLVTAIRGKRFGQAEGLFAGIMQEKVEHALASVRKSLTEGCEHGEGCKDCGLNEADDDKKCTHCGSKKDLEMVDGTAICAECDPER